MKMLLLDHFLDKLFGLVNFVTGNIQVTLVDELDQPGFEVQVHHLLEACHKAGKSNR